MSRRDDEPDAAAVATALRRLAVLLEAGLTPARAWALADRGVDAAESGDAVTDTVADVATVLATRGGAWRDAGVAWRVATAVGAPLAPALRSIAEALRAAQEALDDVRIALAEPAATARLVAWLPLVAVLLGGALGFDLVATLVRPAGLACLAGGVGLMLVAHRWTARLVARARPHGGTPGLQAEVLAVALTGGVSIERAVAVVAEAGGGSPEPETSATLALSRAAGAPTAELLRAAAAEARHRARVEGRMRAARLSGRLLIPLGVCTLPAFLLLGVGPMLLSILAATPLDL